MEKYLWLASVISAHPSHRVVGRTRLQKTIKLLQRLGLPSNYDYVTHFYGPYSESLHTDVGLLQAMGLLAEKAESLPDGSPYYVAEIRPDPILPSVEKFKSYISRLSGEELVTLELAATYDSFREMGYDHQVALQRLRRKKGAKCDRGREEKALRLLDDLGLSTSATQ